MTKIDCEADYSSTAVHVRYADDIVCLNVVYVVDIVDVAYIADGINIIDVDIYVVVAVVEEHDEIMINDDDDDEVKLQMRMG